MKKNDYMLISIILLLALFSYFCFQIFSDEGNLVVVYVDGMEYGTYDLSLDQTIEINETNTLEISEGDAYMVEADCPDGLCIHQGAINQDMESIICLPNRVVVEVHSSEESEYDAISK